MMQLILDSYGAALRQKDGCFEVKHREGVSAFAPEKIATISVSKGVNISADAIMLAIRHEIDVIFLDGNGQPQGRVWSQHYGSIATIRRKQALFNTRVEATHWVREVLLFKLESQAALLRALLNTKKDLHKELTNAIDIAINIIHNTANKIRTIEDTNLNAIAPTLRGWEGTASKAYFGVLGKMLPEPYSFTKRSKHPAKDPFNAMINYLYGMLYSRVEGDLILAGIDPYLGIFHSDMHKRPVLAYDFIELWRTWADNVALKIFFADLIDDACFETDNTTGAVWLLGPGKQIAATAFNEYLSQVIDLNGNRRSRREHIRLYTQHFATKLKELPDEDPDSTTI